MLFCVKMLKMKPSPAVAAAIREFHPKTIQFRIKFWLEQITTLFLHQNKQKTLKFSLKLLSYHWLNTFYRLSVELLFI